MRTVGNILWLVSIGWQMAMWWVFAGLLMCVTVIGIPFGLQCFKIAGFALWPFGRTAIPTAQDTSFHVVGNVLWFIPGLFIAGWYAMAGVLWCLTIIGIPFGLQAFKFIPLALLPFGKQIVPIDVYANRYRPVVPARPVGYLPSAAR